MIKRVDTVIVLAITPEGQVVVINEEQPNRKQQTALPAGRCEREEDRLLAAKRELAEETGYTSDNWEHWQTIDPMHKAEWSLHFFIARDAHKTTEPHLDPGERIETKLMSVEEFLQGIIDQTIDGAEIERQVLRARLDPAKWQELVSYLKGQ
jgi:ADP-ribose pyrophosphatase